MPGLIRQGAWDQLGSLLSGQALDQHPAVTGAAVAGAMEEALGKRISVLMPYVDQLEVFGLWYRQPWAESLGKNGRARHRFVPWEPWTSILNYSCIWMASEDKWFTVIRKMSQGHGTAIQTSDEKLGYLQGRTLGDLLDAEAQATAGTLVAKGRAVRELLIESVDERTMGQLLMHFMLETILTAQVLGIDAFDQPAVEDIKILTRAKMAESAGA